MDPSINHTRPPYGILSVLMVGAFIAFLNNTLLNIALPSIMTELQINTATVQWLTTGFMLVNGILMPATAFLIEKYSVRRLFLVAMSLFTFGTIIAGMAHTFPILLSGRLLQASGSAIMMPLLMNVMLVSFPVEKRGTAMGVFGLILMSAPAIGPTLSGWIIEHYDWRMLFHFVTPIAVTIFMLGFFMLKDKKGKVDIKLDIFSLIISSIGFGGLLFGFSSAGNMGWGNPIVFGTITIGFISLVIFIVRQNRLAKPMLDFHVFKYPMFALSSTISIVVNMSMFSGMLLIPIYVQSLRGFSPMEAGLLMLPGALANAFMSPITGRLFDKFGGRALAIVGLSITVVTTYLFGKLTFETSYNYLVILHAIRMFGMSMVFMPVSTNGLNQLPRRFYPHGTAMNNTLNQVSAAIGTALLITLMSTKSDSHAAGLMKSLTGEPTEAAMQQIEAQGMLAGINFSFIIASFITVVALILAIFIKRATPAKDPLEEKANQQVKTKLAEN